MKYESLRGRANWWTLNRVYAVERGLRWFADRLERIHSAGAVHLWKHTPSKTEDNAGLTETVLPGPVFDKLLAELDAEDAAKKVCTCSNAQVTEPSICEAHGEFLRCPCGLEHVWEPE